MAHHYQLTLHKWFRVNETYPPMPLHSWYPITLEAPMTVPQAQNLTSWMVALERMMTSNQVEFGRTTITELHPDAPFHIATPFHTQFPFADLRTAEYEKLRGTRQGAMFGEIFSCSIKANRLKGSAWKKDIHCCFGEDDLGEVYPTNGKTFRSNLKPNGPFGGWCMDWFRFVLDEQYAVNLSLDLDRYGQWKFSQVAPGVLRLGAVSQQTDLQNYAAHPTAVHNWWWQMGHDVDTMLAKLLLGHSLMMDTFDHRWGDGHAPDLRYFADTYFELAKLWRPIYHLMGWDVPAETDLLIHDLDYWFPGGGADLFGALEIKENPLFLHLLAVELYDCWLWFRQRFTLTTGGYIWNLLPHENPNAAPQPGFAVAHYIYLAWDEIQGRIFSLSNTCNLLTQCVVANNRRQSISNGWKSSNLEAIPRLGAGPTYPPNIALHPYLVTGPRSRDPHYTTTPGYEPVVAPGSTYPQPNYTIPADDGSGGYGDPGQHRHAFRNAVGNMVEDTYREVSDFLTKDTVKKAVKWAVYVDDQVDKVAPWFRVLNPGKAGAKIAIRALVKKYAADYVQGNTIRDQVDVSDEYNALYN